MFSLSLSLRWAKVWTTPSVQTFAILFFCNIIQLKREGAPAINSRSANDGWRRDY